MMVMRLSIFMQIVGFFTIASSVVPVSRRSTGYRNPDKGLKRTLPGSSLSQKQVHLELGSSAATRHTFLNQSGRALGKHSNSRKHTTKNAKPLLASLISVVSVVAVFGLLAVIASVTQAPKSVAAVACILGTGGLAVGVCLIMGVINWKINIVSALLILFAWSIFVIVWVGVLVQWSTNISLWQKLTNNNKN